MLAALQILESVVTAPGRLIVWFRWAMPGNWIHHDNAARDDRVLHWICSAGFYVSAALFWKDLLRDGQGAVYWANLKIALGIA